MIQYSLLENTLPWRFYEKNLAMFLAEPVSDIIADMVAASMLFYINKIVDKGEKA